MSTVINLTVNLYELDKRRWHPRFYEVIEIEPDEEADNRTTEQRMADLERDLSAFEKRVR